VPQATITAQVHEPFDIHGYFATAITFNHKILIQNFSNFGNVSFSNIVTAHGIAQPCQIENSPGRGPTYTMDIGQSNLHMFIFG
jgi:hypothetical protein